MDIGSGVDKWVYIFKKLIEKLPITLAIIALSLFFGFLMGLAVAVVRIRRRPVSYGVATFYLSFTRCTPALVQLFLIYYGLPQLLMLFKIDINDWNKMIFVIITFTFLNGAFLSEVIRSAYLAVGNDQLEAAYSVGMSYFQAFKRIILPQAFKIALPNLGNSIISLLKETSLAYTIGVVDIMGEVRIIIGNNYGTNMFEVYIVISLVYWVLCIAIEGAVGLLERAYGKGQVSISGGSD